MKNLFNTFSKSSLAAIILLASMFSINASAATVTASAAIVNADKGSSPLDIKKVIVTGNTKVLIIQNANESVSMDEEALDKVSLKQVGNTLTISSSELEPVTVTVYVKDIYRIAASDRASVRTLGTFDVKNLQVILKDEATARVKASTESLYTTIDGHAALTLIGTSGSHVYKMANSAKIDTDKFAALKTESLDPLATVTASASNKKSTPISK